MRTKAKAFPHRFKGLWDRLTGGHSRTKTQNEREAYEAFMRDRAEKEQLIFQQMEQRRGPDATQVRDRNEHQQQKQELRQDVQVYEGMLYPSCASNDSKNTAKSAPLALLRGHRTTATGAGRSIDETRLVRSKKRRPSEYGRGFGERTLKVVREKIPERWAHWAQISVATGHSCGRGNASNQVRGLFGFCRSTPKS